MKVSHFVSLCFALSVCFNGIFAQSPNVLLVIADDVGVGEIPNYTPDVIKANMPHLEALMQEGLTFDNVWSNPVCAPSRANILTGKHGFRTNVLNAENLSTLSTEETSLHTYIDESTNGLYSNSLIGKWHLGGGGGMNPNYNYPNELGIDYFAGIMSGGVADYNSYTLVEDQDGATSTEYITTKFTDLAIDWINDQEQPWFCWLAYTTPHTPLHLPPANMHSQGDLPADQASIDANPQPYFLAMIESLDFELGRLMDQIPADELANTVIIFVGDNGTSRNLIQAPYPSGNRGKGSVYQGGVHVPMVVSGAGVNRVNEREDALVSFSDLFTTIVELTGTSLSQIHDSYSFAHLLSSEGEGQRDCMYTEVDSDGESPSWASRDATYKYISLANGSQRFYNLIDDPYELDNLLPLAMLDDTELASFNKLSTFRDALTPVNNLVELGQKIDFFPNPASDKIYINHQGESAQIYQIFDLKGKEILSGHLDKGNNQISIETVPQGAYIIKIGDQVQRFVKL